VVAVTRVLMPPRAATTRRPSRLFGATDEALVEIPPELLRQFQLTGLDPIQQRDPCVRPEEQFLAVGVLAVADRYNSLVLGLFCHLLTPLR
jgi:hypothetical protein